MANGLETTLGFTGDELALNQQGRVSERQQAMLGKANKTVNVFSRLMIVVVIVFVVIAAVVAASSSSSSETAPYIVGAVALVVVVMTFSIRRTLGASARLVKANVQHAEGPARHRVVKFGESVDNPGMGGGVRFDIQVGEQRLTCPSQAAMESFTEGALYRVHYIREASLHVLLSAEPL